LLIYKFEFYFRLAIEMQSLRKQNVIGVGITPTSYEEVVETCKAWLADRDNRRQAPGLEQSVRVGRYITVTSVHGVISSVTNTSFRECINQADIATPDGMPIVWALRSFGSRGQQRVYGPNLMLFLCEMAANNGRRVFLYGSRDEALKKLEQNLQTRYPELQIVGTYSPPFRPLSMDESTAIVRRISEVRADLVFVGLSTPKQERWMLQHRSRLPGMVLVGVGAAFDFHAGTLRQAPEWMQQSGLEWLFRLMAEPRRLWKRYLFVTPLFLPLWALQLLGILPLFPRFSRFGFERPRSLDGSS
jgi:N-acetylglucosaminyldiphosphoundecaprenol N-acetyl-beta-D-mannosaminyltransferase